MTVKNMAVDQIIRQRDRQSQGETKEEGEISREI